MSTQNLKVEGLKDLMEAAAEAETRWLLLHYNKIPLHKTGFFRSSKNANMQIRRVRKSTHTPVGL